MIAYMFQLYSMNMINKARNRGFSIPKALENYGLWFTNGVRYLSALQISLFPRPTSQGK